MASLALRRPEYTGENRCWPCTVANGAILLACCLAVAPFSPPLALAGLLAGAGAIRFRGYLVPYTPQLTGRVRRALADEPDQLTTGSLAPGETDGDEELGERTLAALVGVGVIRPEGERLHLDDGFVDDWRGEMRRLRALPDRKLFEAAGRVGDMTVTNLDASGDRLVLAGSGGDEAWVSRSVVVAELAAVGTLEERAPGLPDADRLGAARALRAFLEECPLCDGFLEERRPRRCCGSYREAATGTVLACPDCDQVLHRFDA